MSKMPVECLRLGYAGYPVQPPETVWSKHVAERVATVGIDTYTNNSNEKSSGMPDTVMQGPFGFVYVEFKGPSTPVRGNQSAIAKRMNAKSFYSRGELCCFVYRAPDIFGVLKGESIVQLAEVDALSNPIEFAQTLTMYVDVISTGDGQQKIDNMAMMLGLPLLSSRLFRVSHVRRTHAESFKQVVEAPTKELALKIAAGTPVLSRTHMISQTFFSVEQIR